jgi:DNA mismatch repair protein MutS
MFKRMLALYITCATLLNPVLIVADEAIQEKNLAQHVSNKYLTSMFGEEKPAIAPVIDPNANFMEKLKQQMDPKAQILTPREAQEVAFSLTSSTQNFDTNVVDASCIDKLEIVGGGENNSFHLFNKIFKNINTAIGRSHAALAFCHPIIDINILRNRQNAINYLKENNTLLEQFDTSLQATSSFETKSFMHWHLKPAVNQELIRNSYFGSMINLGSIAKQLNTNTAALESMNRFYVANLAAIPATLAYGIHKFAKQNNMPFTTVTMNILKELKSISINALQSASIQHYAYAAIGTAYFGGAIYFIGNVYASYEKMYQHMQEILIATSSHVKELQILSDYLNKTPELLTYLPSLQPLADLNNPAKHSAKFNKLLGMLNTNTFEGKASFFSIAGRVLAAYELMKEIKDELAPVFAAAGELDMYVALAKLYSEHEDKQARYCMVDFIENSTTPVIKAQNFWNPFIDADKVVVNNATFDVSCPNSILTGPNTGGKSTVIKAIMLDVLMAQTFGIAPAESLSMTPFAKLNCFMNISDDIATGASLFKSEVMRAKKLLDLVQSLKQAEFSFVIIDEVFTGTSPQEGEQAALRFAKQIGSYTNNISIIATHYPKMVDLENETHGNYRNHHVEILRNEDGSLNRTFKLKNGPSFMNVAFDILEEEGLFV